MKIKRILSGMAVLVLVLFSTSGQTQRTNPTPYEKIKAMMKQTADTHPQTATLFPLGDSNSGEVIWGLEIGHGPVHNLVVATHHGNEYGSLARR